MGENYINPDEENVKLIQKVLDECSSSWLELKEYTFYKCLNRRLSMEQRGNYILQELDAVEKEKDEFVYRCPQIKTLPVYKFSIWDCDFLESINREERHCYFTFNAKTISLNALQADIKSYDEKLPYFSSLVTCVVLFKYYDILVKHEKLYEDHIKKNTKRSPVDIKLVQRLIADFEKENNIPKKQKQRTFESTLNDNQIADIVKAANTWHLFTKEITVDDIKRFMLCEDNASLQPTVNNYVIYLLKRLADEGFISRYWQSATYKRHMLLSSSGEGKYLKQTDISSILSTLKDSQTSATYKKIDKLVNKIKNPLT